MIRYKIIEEKHRFALESEVNKALMDGWVVCGGIGVTLTEPKGYLNEQDVIYLQALVKEEK